MKQLIVTIGEDHKPTFETRGGKFNTMEFYGIAQLLNTMATAEENAKIAAALFSDEEEGDVELAMAESAGRSGNNLDH